MIRPTPLNARFFATSYSKPDGTSLIVATASFLLLFFSSPLPCNPSKPSAPSIITSSSSSILDASFPPIGPSRIAVVERTNLWARAPSANICLEYRSSSLSTFFFLLLLLLVVMMLLSCWIGACVCSSVSSLITTSSTAASVSFAVSSSLLPPRRSLIDISECLLYSIDFFPHPNKLSGALKPDGIVRNSLVLRASPRVDDGNESNARLVEMEDNDHGCLAPLTDCWRMNRWNAPTNGKRFKMDILRIIFVSLLFTFVARYSPSLYAHKQFCGALTTAGRIRIALGILSS